MSLIAWYPLNGNLEDYSGNGNHLTYINNTGILVSTSTGKIGYAYQRVAENNGNDLFRSSKPIYLPNDITIACWAKVTAASQAANGLVSNHDHNTNSGLGINVIPSSSSDYRISCSTGSGSDRTYQSYYGTTNIKDKWSHLLLRFIKSTNTLSLWVNGVKEFETSYAQYNKSDYIDIFNWSTGYHTSNVYRTAAILNDVRVYDHALSEKEIKEIAKAKILHYTFDDFQEPTENILSLAGYNAELERSGTDYPYTIVDITTIVRSKWTTTNNNITLSFEGKRDGTGSYPEAFVFFSDWSWALVANTTSATWAFAFNTTAMPDPSTKTVYFAVYHMPAGGTGLSYSRKHQLEFKSYYTPFINGTRSGIINDSSGLKNNAALSLLGTPRWVSDSKIGSGAYSFNGLTTKIDLDNLSTSDNKITMSAWVYTKTLSKTSAIIRKENSFLLQTNTSGQFRPHVYINGNWYALTTAINTIQLNTWQLLSAVYDGVNLIAYVNGQEIQRTSLTGFINPSSYTTNFGYHATTEWHDGYLDDIRIYATALSDSDILELYQTRASVDSSGNLFIEEINENTLNRCPSFEKWTLSGGASLNNGILSMPLGSNVLSPYIYIGLNSDWSFRADYFAVEQSNNVSFQPNAGYLMGSHYYDGLLNSTPNTDNYAANGHADNYPINSWTTKTWSYSGGNLIEYIRVNISADSTYGQPSGFKIKNPMLTTDLYSGKYINYSSRIVDKTENTKIKLFNSGVYKTNEASEVGITEGLIAYYPFDRDARDYSGNGYHGVVSGAVLSGGIKGGAYSFDGINDSISVVTTNFNRVNNEELTVSAWIKPSRLGGQYQEIIANRSSAAYNWMIFQHTTDGSIQLHGANQNKSTYIPTINNWIQVTATVDINQNYKLYINGALIQTVTGFTFGATSSQLSIGYFPSTEYFLGAIDEVRIYNRALSIEEILILYETTAPTTAAMKLTKDTVYLKGEFKEVI